MSGERKSKIPNRKQIMDRANKCGLAFRGKELENWKTKSIEELTEGEAVARFALDYLHVPEGPMVGQPLELDDYQVAFCRAVFDNPAVTRKAILSVARRSGKTFVIAVILLYFIVGAGSKTIPNSMVASAAMNRDQAALCFRLMTLMLRQSPELDGLYHIVPSSKRIIGLRNNVEYMALSADAKGGQGKSIAILLLDEAGQIVESENDYVSMLRSSQGSYESAKFLIVSTQAPQDSSFLSLEIDAAIRDQDPKTVCHVYAASPDADLNDEAEWYYANPGLGKYRSETDLREQIKDAIAMPAKMPGVQNLLLNMRVSLTAGFISSEVYKANMTPPDYDVFRNSSYVTMGLDLSMVNDLSAAVICAKDDSGKLHVHCFAFSPLNGLEQRAMRDRNPYVEWFKDGTIYCPPGDTLNYDMICGYLRDKLEDMGITIHEVLFDRYRIDVFKNAAEREGFGQSAVFTEVGQGFVSMGKLIDQLETCFLERKLCIGRSPIIAMGCSTAVVETDNVGNRRVTKKKSANKIDGLVALLMAAWPHLGEAEEIFDVAALIA
jgi:phage terminase large subunit-like protein